MKTYELIKDIPPYLDSLKESLTLLKDSCDCGKRTWFTKLYCRSISERFDDVFNRLKIVHDKYAESIGLDKYKA